MLNDFAHPIDLRFYDREAAPGAFAQIFLSEELGIPKHGVQWRAQIVRNFPSHSSECCQALNTAKLKLQAQEFCFGLLALDDFGSHGVVGLAQLRGAFSDALIELIVSFSQGLFGPFSSIGEITG
jgi:hypothetical protein